MVGGALNEEEGRIHPLGAPPEPPVAESIAAVAGDGDGESKSLMADFVPPVQPEEERDEAAAAAAAEEKEDSALLSSSSREVRSPPLKTGGAVDAEEEVSQTEKIRDKKEEEEEEEEEEKEEELGIACHSGKEEELPPLAVVEKDEMEMGNNSRENPASSTDLPLQMLHGDDEEEARSEHRNENVEEELAGIPREPPPTFQQHRMMIQGLDGRGEGGSGNGNGRAFFPGEELDGEGESLRIMPTDVPPSVMKVVHVLECESDAPEGLCHVYLVGTAHVSQESCKEVQAVIRHLKPQVVFLELCKNRVSMLMPQSLQVPTFKEMVEMWKNKRMNLFGILYSWFLAKVANELEVFPGSEFRVAYEEALACGAKVSLGDRDVQITLKRTWAKMTFWYKMKLVFSMLFQVVFLPSADELNRMMKDMENMDMVTLMVQEMSKSFPSLMETLVHERDMYMAAMLQKIARHSSLVVAVVGKGHLTGITNNWNAIIPVEALLEIPQKKKKTTNGYMQTCFLTIAVGGIAVASGLYIRSRW